MDKNTSSSPPVYELSAARGICVGLPVISLEGLQALEWAHLPEPFDIVNHAGNFGASAFIAGIASIAYAVKNKAYGYRDDLAIDQEAMSRFRRRGVATILGLTALVNLTTETQWGVEYLPIARALGGETPDVLDTLWSTVWAGIFSLAIWRRRKA